MPLINVPLQLGGKLLALSNLSPHYHSHHPGSKCAHCCSLMDTSVLTKSRLSPWVLNPIAFNGLEDSLGSPVTIYRIIPFGQQACSGIFSQTREIKALFRPPTHSTLRPLSPLSAHQSFSSITELYSVLNKCQACPFTGDKNHCHSCFTVDPFILDYLSLTHFVYLSSITNWWHFDTSEYLLFHFPGCSLHGADKHLPWFNRDTFAYTCTGWKPVLYWESWTPIGELWPPRPEQSPYRSRSYLPSLE